MKTIKYLLPLCCVVLASCTDSKLDVPAQEKPSANGTVLTAVIGEETKTVLGEKEGNSYPISWSDGDMINVNGESSKAVSLEAASKTASFEFEKELTAPYCAVYPSSVLSEESITIPSKQSYKQGSFDASSAIMLSYATEGTSLTFHHVMSYLKLSFGVNAGETALEKIMKVEVKSNGTEPMSGAFNVDFEHGSITPAEGNEASIITVNCGTTGVDLGSEIIVAIPAQNYASGLVITTYDKVGNKSVYTTTAVFDAVVGKVYPMPIQMELYPGTTLKAIKVGDLLWAPVYCGYSEAYPNGLLYQYGRAKGQPYYPASPSSEIVKSTYSVINGNMAPIDEYFYKKGNTNNWFNETGFAFWPMKEEDAGYVEGKISNPCPKGWRLPTYDECNELCSIGFEKHGNFSFPTNVGESYKLDMGFALKDSELLFVAVGNRTSAGQSYNRDTGNARCYIWTADKTNDSENVEAKNKEKAYTLFLQISNSPLGKMYAMPKASGCSVRCVKEVE